MPAHRNHTSTFEDLTFAGQAKSLNSTMAYTTKAIRAHLRRARLDERDVDAVRRKCINQVQRLLRRVQEL
jgi:hypothetical protein